MDCERCHYAPAFLPAPWCVDCLMQASFFRPPVVQPAELLAYVNRPKPPVVKQKWNVCRGCGNWRVVDDADCPQCGEARKEANKLRAARCLELRREQELALKRRLLKARKAERAERRRLLKQQLKREHRERMAVPAFMKMRARLEPQFLASTHAEAFDEHPIWAPIPEVELDIDQPRWFGILGAHPRSLGVGGSSLRILSREQQLRVSRGEERADYFKKHDPWSL